MKSRLGKHLSGDKREVSIGHSLPDLERHTTINKVIYLINFCDYSPGMPPHVYTLPAVSQSPRLIGRPSTITLAE